GEPGHGHVVAHPDGRHRPGNEAITGGQHREPEPPQKHLRSGRQIVIAIHAPRPRVATPLKWLFDFLNRRERREAQRQKRKIPRLSALSAVKILITGSYRRANLTRYPA